MKELVCPRCNTKNFGEDNFCSKCFHNILKVHPQSTYGKWLRVVRE